MTRRPRGPTGLAHEATVSRDAVAVAADHQVSSQLGDETVILHLEDGVYYGLDPVGTSIWRCSRSPAWWPRSGTGSSRSTTWTPERCERDLLGLLEDLLGGA
jgi:hypothetical protein